MKVRALVPLAVLLMSGCAEQELPNGYTIQKSAMNREWLSGPDGMMVAPGLVKSLHRRGDRLLLVAHSASAGGQPIPPTPIDDTCYVALSIDTETGNVTQVTVAEADNIAKGLTEVISTDRDC